ncbi:T9SS type A sorting domain-containing protein [Empedobacter brevis]|uniref:T9SS type A sorting domain-containing protein n=1 Tax=Empedobacter brevis TaxID=247 RepID=A0AAJ1QFP5_9FLAO|nr:PKD domain-containing protein [Empedobacter brevis]MDM1073076.1 T9SS type A sorting domain-containing protein [Empedobacter brevis]
MKIKLLFLMVMVFSFTLAQIPKPSFNYTYSVDHNQIILNFKSDSQGDNLEYEWDFPGATLENSELSNPQIVYNSIGEYFVTLKIKNDKGESSISKKIIISGDITSQIVNLSTGINDDGTTMSTEGIPDADWTVTNPDGVTGVPITRPYYSGWSYPVLETNQMFNGKTTWIRSGDLYSGNGDYYYKSKTFVVPENVTNAIVNFRALAFVRHWTYLVRINDDGSETDITEISRTLWLNDGAKGWLNSRNSSVENYVLSPGKYYVRTRVFTNHGSLRDALSVNGYVSIGNSIKVESLTLPVLSINESRICLNETKTIAATVLDNTFSYKWKIYNTQKTYTSDLASPSFQFVDQGSYTVDLKIQKGNLVNSYSFKNQLIVESCGTPVDKNVLAAPNSYIYDVNLASGNNYGGIYIPVKKAYDVWQDTNGFLNQAISGSMQSASVVWQDKENLISSVSIVGTGETAKLKVEVNSSKGKGNAVVALHIGNHSDDSDPIYWSWHIWVTDDPTNGATYVNNGDSRMINTFMDRNLGALSNSFLGHDWNKSGGLMYQWGRKDPFPPLFYLDVSRAEFFTKNKRINDINDFNSLFIKTRQYDIISDNIIYTINNPLNFVKRTEQVGTWFASLNNNIKIKDDSGYAIENYDLWNDNNKGITRKEGFQKQVKSAYDPCPSGWRVPSFAHSDSTIPNYSPWGSRYNYVFNEPSSYTISESSNRYPNVKFYPGMGIDFHEGDDNHYLGEYSSTGAYKLIGARIAFQDVSSETSLWSSTLNQQAQAKFLKIVNDPLNGAGVYSISTSQDTSPGEGLAVRCAKDDTTNIVFNTEYFVSSMNKRNFTEGLDNPNSYILYTNRDVVIPVSKAYAVYNQVLTDRDWIPNGIQTVNVYWTTNKNLVKSLNITGENENATLNINLNDNQYGNAVVSLHIGNQGNSNDPVYWSWHLWVPRDNPEENPTNYATDLSNQVSNFKAFNTDSGFPFLQTEFMSMPLGSLSKFATPSEYIGTNGYAFHYQWGRKDPIPSFYDSGWATTYSIYLGRNNGNGIVYENIDNNDQYMTKGFQALNKQSLLENKDVLKFSVQNPLTFMYNTQTEGGDWLTNHSLYMADRWGHASEKSIYDPCPAGWRVPDFGHNTPLGSPWANAGLKKRIANDGFDQWDVSTKYSDYSISYNGRSNNNGQLLITRSYFYKNSIYNLGFYLPSQGFRGTNIKGARGIFDNNISSTAWSSTLSPSIKGYGNYLDTNIFTGWHNSSNMFKLHNAYSVVCSKDKPRFSKEGFENTIGKRIESIALSYTDVEEVQLHQLSFYPNPMKDILKTTSTEKIKVEIYSMSGEKILTGQFDGQKLNVSQLKPGIYLLVLQNGISYKIIKK